MSKKWIVAAVLLGILAFLIPIEHKYDKLFRFYSLTLIPKGLVVTKQYDNKIYFYISDFVAILLTVIGLIWMRIPLKKWFGSTLWVIWICAFFSIAFSPFANYPIPYFRLLQLFTPIALFSFIANSEYNFTRPILYGIVSSALCQSVIAILQYFHQGPLGLRLFGEVRDMSFFFAPNGSRWILDEWFGRVANEIVVRAQGTMPHANVFGGFLVFSILATYYLAGKNRIWLFTLPLQCFALMLSYSRAALAAWMIATMIWLLFLNRRHMVFFILSLCALLALFSTQLISRGGILNYNQLVQSADAVRITQIETGKKIIAANPYFGVGFSQYSERSGPYFPENTPPHVRATAPHNIFLFLAAETGLIALCSFCLFILTLIFRFFRSPKTPESILFASLMCAFLFIGLFDFYPILFQQGKLMFFLIFALLVANTKRDLVKLSPAYE